MSVFEPTDLTGQEVLTAFRRGTTQVAVKSSDESVLTPVISPATNQPICWFVPTSNDDIAEIVQEAKHALSQPAVIGDSSGPAWSDPAAGPQRSAVLQKWAVLLRQHVDTLARLEVQQIGRPYKEMRFQLSRLPEWFDYFAAMIITQHDQVTPWKQGGYLNVIHRVPLGVVAQITPFNHPLLITIKKLAPALAAGNSVVIKPSELAPASIIALVQLGQQAGIPPGVVNVILGARDQVQCLIRHPIIAKVDFTGGPATGRAIGAAAGENLASVTQELGGKAPMIVCAPKHVEQLSRETINTEYLQPVVNGCAFGAFIASGQTCIAGTRLIVDARWYQDFLDKLVAKTKVFRLGDPLDLETTIGPVITKKQEKWIHQTLHAGIVDSGTTLQILCGGKKFEGLLGTPFAEGNYYEPTIVAVDPRLAKDMTSTNNSVAKAVRDQVTELHHGNSLFQTELFGPVVVVAPFYDHAHAIEMANDTAFGLGASIWSHDLIEAQSLASEVRSGIGKSFSSNANTSLCLLILLTLPLLL